MYSNWKWYLIAQGNLEFSFWEMRYTSDIFTVNVSRFFWKFSSFRQGPSWLYCNIYCEYIKFTINGVYLSLLQMGCLIIKMSNSLLYGPGFGHFHLSPPFEVIFFYDNAFPHRRYLQNDTLVHEISLRNFSMGQNTQCQNALS